MLPCAGALAVEHTAESLLPPWVVLQVSGPRSTRKMWMKHKAQILPGFAVSILRSCPSWCVSLLMDTPCPGQQSPVCLCWLGTTMELCCMLLRAQPVVAEETRPSSARESPGEV